MLGNREPLRRWSSVLISVFEKEGFPGGPVVKNSFCNAGDTGLTPGSGRSYMPQSSQAYA